MEETYFGSREAASTAAAEFLAACLKRRLDEQRRASLIITGGSSPAQCYEHLSTLALDWDRVDLVLSDERWVPADHADSNERQAREKLVVNAAASANLVPMFDADEEIEARAEQLNTELKHLPVPYSAALLGMGEDGHFASLFPDTEGLDEALDTDNPAFCLPVRTAASPHPRLSLTLSAISRSDAIVLLIFGESKKAVIEAAKSGDERFPVTTLLRQKHAPVYVYWAE